MIASSAQKRARAPSKAAQDRFARNAAFDAIHATSAPLAKPTLEWTYLDAHTRNAPCGIDLNDVHLTLAPPNTQNNRTTTPTSPRLRQTPRLKGVPHLPRRAAARVHHICPEAPRHTRSCVCNTQSKPSNTSHPLAPSNNQNKNNKTHFLPLAPSII